MIDLIDMNQQNKIKQINFIKEKSISLNDINSQVISIFNLSDALTDQFYRLGKNIYYQYFDVTEQELIKQFYNYFEVTR